MIYLARHGETEFNAVGRQQGHLDSPLTENGKRQARYVADRLSLQADPRFRIVSSPLGRATQTAAIISSVLEIEDQSFVVDDRLSEVGLGAWEGSTRKEIEQNWPDVAPLTSVRKAWASNCPNGERVEAVIARLSDWLREFETTHAIVVCHGIAGSILRGIYIGLTIDEMFCLPSGGHDQIFLLEGGAITEV